jgi:hypothetical protein
MKNFLRFAVVAFGVAISLPILHKATGFPPNKPLVGVETAAKRPEKTWSAWWDGKMQAGFEARLNQRIGLRGLMVRTANQINFSLFGVVPTRRGTNVTRGRNGFWFEGVYVDEYGKPGGRPEEDLRITSANVRRLQEHLEADGIGFVLVISPSKAEVYPEHLPEGTDVEGRAGRRSNYDNLIGHLRRDGVNLIDAHELFREWRGDPATPMLFTRGGTHWNQYGAARVVELLCQRLREQTGKDMPSIRVTGATTNSMIVGADNDLVDLLNLWTRRRLAGPQTHPVVERLPGTYEPNLLFVGDSFVFTLTGIMDQHRLYARRDTYYYFNRQFFYPEQPEQPIDRKRLDVLADVRSRDAVVFEINEYWLPKIGFGFMGEALKAYDAQGGEEH